MTACPSGRPDGRAVTFARSVDAVSRVMRVDVETGEVTRMQLGEPDADSLSWWRG